MRERRNESERPKAQRRLSVAKNLAQAQPADEPSLPCERSGRRAGAKCSRRGNQGAKRRSRREKRTRGPPVSRPAACGGARSGRKVAGPRAMFRPRRRKARQPSRLRLAATTMPRERIGVTGAPPAQRAAGRTPASASVGALRGVPARMGRARRRLDRGERLFPGRNGRNSKLGGNPYSTSAISPEGFCVAKHVRAAFSFFV